MLGRCGAGQLRRSEASRICEDDVRPFRLAWLVPDQRFTWTTLDGEQRRGGARTEQDRTVVLEALVAGQSHPSNQLDPIARSTTTSADTYSSPGLAACPRIHSASHRARAGVPPRPPRRLVVIPLLPFVTRPSAPPHLDLKAQDCATPRHCGASSGFQIPPRPWPAGSPRVGQHPPPPSPIPRPLQLEGRPGAPPTVSRRGLGTP